MTRSPGPPSSDRAESSAPGTACRLDFDLTQLPVNDRFPFWRDQGSLLYRPRPEGLSSERPLAVRSQMERLGPITLASMEATAQHYERTAAMMRRDGQEHYLLALLENGQVEHAVAGCPTTIWLRGRADLVDRS